MPRKQHQEDRDAPRRGHIVRSLCGREMPLSHETWGAESCEACARVRAARDEQSRKVVAFVHDHAQERR